MKPSVSVSFLSASLVALCIGLGVPGTAVAQEARGLSDRLDRLERDLSTLQGQVYRGGGSSSSSGGGAALSGDTYSMLDQRINALEGQLRDLTNQIEKSTYATSQMQSKLDRMEKDNDFRFKELEQKSSAGAPPAGGQSQQQGNNGAPSLTPPSGGNSNAAKGDWNPTMGSPPGNLGQIPVNDLKREQQSAASQPAAAQQQAKGLPGKTPQEKYDYAFDLLKKNDYDGASNALQQFVQQYPQDPLAGNAVYWQGQIPYAQGQFDKAAPLFVEAYRKYPKSAKAGDSLLKAGLSLSNLNKKKEACAVFQRFLSEFPDAGDNLRRQATQEKSKLGC